MKLDHGLHLAYCTNIHRGEDWAETFAALERYTLAVRDRVAGGKPYAIGLRLSARAALELSERGRLVEFQKWLDAQQCYIFTINGFPYGNFHGTRVKEQVYLPDWTAEERVQYTNRLFDLLAELVPPGIEGSVSTVPCSFKEFIRSDAQVQAMRANLWRCVEHIARLSERTGKMLHLGLEPEPLCYLETSAEAALWFQQMRAERGFDPRLERHLGINYDACHLAVEFENPEEAIRHLRQHNIKISKIHLSSALRAHPTVETRRALEAFAEGVYFHQVIQRSIDGTLERYRDLPEALARFRAGGDPHLIEWRIHFHVPLHSRPTPLFQNTADHILGLLDVLKLDPTLCRHLEMETYTWEVLPAELKERHVIDQLADEYAWTLARMRERGLAA